MRGAWIAVMLVSLALAGCSGGKEKDDGPEDGKDDADPGALTNSTVALTAVISVAVNGTAVVPSNGSFAVNESVALTFDASNSTGAIVSYAWDFGDNATSEDRVAEHAYAAAGNYTVKLTVANGNLSSNATVKVIVLGAVAAQLLFTQHEEFDGTVPLFNPNSPFQPGVDYVDHVVAVAAADANGTAAVAMVVRIHVESSPFSVFVYWRGPDGTNLATAGGAPDTSTEQDILYEAAMPPGEYVVRVRVFAGAATSYDGTVDIDYLTA